MIDFLFFKKDGIIKKILFKDILYIESFQDYVKIHLSEIKFITIHSTLSRIEETLQKDKFIRTHRCYLVNSDKISSIEYDTCFLEGHTKGIPISEGYRKYFLEKINYIPTTHEAKKKENVGT